MTTEQRSEDMKLDAILDQFNPADVARVLSKRGIAPKERLAIPSEYVIGLGSIEAAKLLLRQGRHNASLLAAGAGVLPLAATASAGITIQCGTSIVLYSKQGGTETEYDLPEGDNAATVQRNAKSLAEDNAKTNVQNDLNRQAAMINCPTGCSKQVAVASIRITTAGSIVASNTGGTVYDWYTGSAEADGTMSVNCV